MALPVVYLAKPKEKQWICPLTPISIHIHHDALSNTPRAALFRVFAGNRAGSGASVGRAPRLGESWKAPRHAETLARIAGPTAPSPDGK